MDIEVDEGTDGRTAGASAEATKLSKLKQAGANHLSKTFTTPFDSRLSRGVHRTNPNEITHSSFSFNKVPCDHHCARASNTITKGSVEELGSWCWCEHTLSLVDSAFVNSNFFWCKINSYPFYAVTTSKYKTYFQVTWKTNRCLTYQPTIQFLRLQFL